MMEEKSNEWELIEEIINEDSIEAQDKFVTFFPNGYKTFRVVCDFSVNGNTQCFISANKQYASAYHLGNVPYLSAGTRSFDSIIELYGDDDVHAHGTYSDHGYSPVEFDVYRTERPQYPITEICVWTNTASIVPGGKFTLFGQK